MFKKRPITILTLSILFFMIAPLHSFAEFGGSSFFYNASSDDYVLQYDYQNTLWVEWSFWKSEANRQIGAPADFSGKFQTSDGYASFHCNGTYDITFIGVDPNTGETKAVGYDGATDVQSITSSGEDCTSSGIIDIPNEVQPEDPPSDPDPFLPDVSDVHWSSTQTSISLTWTNPNVSDFKQVNVYVDGQLYRSTTGNSMTITGLTPNTPYNITIETEDTHGHKSGNAQQTVWTMGKLEDVISSTTTDSAHFQFPTTGGDYDHTNVYRNGQKIGETSNGQFDDTGLDPDKEYQYEFKNVDKKGNESGGFTITVKTQCSVCQVFECPGWDQYMGKLNDIINKIPPPTNWDDVVSKFRDMLGGAPSTTPTPPPQPPAPSDNGLKDDEPTMNTPPGLDDSGFSKDDIESQAPTITEDPDPTGGFKIDNPVDALPPVPDGNPKPGMDAGEYGKNKPEPTDATPPAPPSEQPTAPTTGPTPGTDAGTPPTPGSTDTNAPTPTPDDGGDGMGWKYYKQSP